MAEITAAVVKSLRDKTGLPMMKCKEALQDTGGDEQAAIDWLRKDNIKMQESRIGRETAFGRMGLYADWDKGVGAMVELLCESAPVAKPTTSSCAWPTTWPSNWPPAQAARHGRRAARSSPRRSRRARRWASRSST